jgi:hypothetical protein
MKKALIIAATAVAVIGGSAAAWHAYAQPYGWRHMHRSFDAADMTAFAEARIAALKAGLALTAEQESLWPPVETALRDLAGKRAAWHEQRREGRAERRDRARDESADPIERMRRGAERMGEAATGLTGLADAAEPLYQSLDEAQKRRLQVLIERGRPGMHRRGGHHRFGNLGDEGRHFGRPMGRHDRTGWGGEGRTEQPANAERL